MNNSYRLRTFFVFTIFSFFYAIVLFNLYLIQIINADYYTQLAQKQYKIELKTYPSRALIFDRNSNPIALNKECLSAFILPHKIENPEQLNKFLKKNFPQAFEKLKNYKNKYFMFIKRKLTAEQVKLIQQANLEDIKILKEPSRFYPMESLATIIGITDIDNNGLFGIEKEFNEQLAGSPESMILERDSRSGHFYFKKETKTQGKEGKPIILTIDKDLQFLAYQELKDRMSELCVKEGAIVIINPTNGDILSMVNLPMFDPKDEENLKLDLTKNKAITDCYEFGSIIKVLLALAALEDGVVTPETLIDCENKKVTIINGMKFSTHDANGILKFSEVIEKSNNIGTAKVAKKIGPKLYDYYTRLGFGQKIGIGLPGEQKGFVNHPNNWSNWSIISLSFGYEISATLLQLAKAFSIIANDGYDIQPRLIMEPQKNNPNSDNKKRIYSQKTIDDIKQILQKTVTQGTAHKAQIKGYNVMVKTGTANLVVNGRYCYTKNIYTAVGIIEKNDYKRVIAVFLKELPENVVLKERGRVYASTITVPLFEQIAEKILIKDKIL